MWMEPGYFSMVLGGALTLFVVNRMLRGLRSGTGERQSLTGDGQST